MAAVCELVLAAGLLAAPVFAVPVAACVVALFLAFCGVVLIAIRKGTSCGCFGSLSDGVSGAAELTHTAALTLMRPGCWAAISLAGRTRSGRRRRS